MINQLLAKEKCFLAQPIISLLLVFVLLSINIEPVKGQTTYGRIVSFDFSNTNGFLTSMRSVFNQTPYVDTSVVFRGGGLTNGYNTTLNGNFIINNYFMAVGWTATSEAQAVSMNTFMRFRIIPKTGYEYRIDSLYLRWRSAAFGATNVFVRSSYDNYTTTIASATVTRGTSGILKLQLTKPVVSDTTINFRIYAYGADAFQNFGFGESPININNPDIEARGRMTLAVPSAQLIQGIGPTTICQGSPALIKNIFTYGTPPYRMYLHDGSGQQFVVSYNNEIDSIQLYPDNSLTYTMDSVVDVNGHKAISLNGSASFQVTQTIIENGIGLFASTQTLLDGASQVFSTGAQCALWLKIKDSTDGVILGDVTSSVYNNINAAYNSTARFFSPRKITISANQVGNSRLTFFYSQADFDLFNSQTSYQKKMPLDSLDVLNYKENIRVVRSSSNPESINSTELIPISVYWNSSKQCWEVVCNVAGSILNGNFYLSSPFLSNKMVDTITHLPATPTIGSSSSVVTIDWNDISGVTQYRFRIRPQGQLTWNVSTVTGSTRILSNLLFNTTYEVQIRVYESALVQGEYTSTFTFTTPFEPNRLSACAPPICVIEGIDAHAAQISWGNVINAQSYQVDIRIKNTLNWGSAITTSNQFAFNSLNQNTTYEFRVRTLCFAGSTAQPNSEYSLIDTFKTTYDLYCEAPINLMTSNIESNSAEIKWHPMFNGNLYHVQLRIKSNLTWGGTTTADTMLLFNTLLPNTTYEYRVRTLCNGGITTLPQSDFSAINEFSTPPVSIGVCLPPTNINTLSTMNSVLLSWTNSANGNLYFIQFKPSTSPSWGGLSTSNNSYLFNNLNSNTTYQYRIRTTCSVGTTTNGMSVFSNVGIITTSSLKPSTELGNEDVFPNPTLDNITISRHDINNDIINVSLYDLTGRFLKQSSVFLYEGITTWNYSLKEYPPGFYILRTNSKNGYSKSYKIQRN